MHRISGARQRAIEGALEVLTAYEPERAAQFEREFERQDRPESRLAVRESLAEALFEHGEDEAAMAVLCS